MYYKILILLFLVSCATPIKVEKEIISQRKFSNKGFALLYTEDLKKNKTVANSIEERSLTIFQKNLDENTIVKITNLFIELPRIHIYIRNYIYHKI